LVESARSWAAYNATQTDLMLVYQAGTLSGNPLAMAAGIAGLALLMQGQAFAAPSKAAKTQLVAFATSAFPYDGQPPGYDKPFLDVDKDGRRGHTTRSGTIHWQDTTYADRRVLLHIPRGFNPARPGLIVVYFHGNAATLERDVQKRQQVHRQVAQSGLNAVLVAPQLAVDAWDSSAGRFWEQGALRRFLEEAAAHLARLHGDPRLLGAFDAMPAVIVAYSGGYLPAVWSLHHGGAGDRVQGVILLDALYGEMEKFARWIAARSNAFFLSAYSRSVREENATFQKLLTERSIDFATSLPTILAPGSVAFLATADEVQHKDFVSSAWVGDPLKAILERIPGYRRTPPASRATRKH
jgi:hypothetical protein